MGLQCLWKVFKRLNAASKKTFLPSFCFCSCFHNSAKHLGEVRPVGPAPPWLTNPSHDITANLHSCSASEEIQTPLSGRNCIFWSSKQHKQDEMNLKKKFKKIAGKQMLETNRTSLSLQLMLTSRKRWSFDDKVWDDVFKGHVTRRSVMFCWPLPGSYPPQRGGKPHPTIWPPCRVKKETGPCQETYTWTSNRQPALL